MSEQVVTKSPVEIPAHLRQFVVEQQYSRYTPVNQATWRYVLRQNSAFLAEKGYGSYLDGLRAAGVSVEYIPNIEEMNAHLAELGWRAVVVDGVIPTTAFLDFQARGMLPIACDIRSLEHVAYTPAPDIIHESAGHAPVLTYGNFGELVKRFGEIGRKALSSKEDHEVYEAFRLISILKESPDSTPEEIEAGEARLAAAQATVTTLSEDTQAARFYWWTVEYGLIGELNDPKIYGAGLLSSMGESRTCLQADVEKIPFSLDAIINTDFNITKPQPQLFVIRDFEAFGAAVEELASRMAFRIGGTESLLKALNSANTATMQYSSGLQVSGTLTDLEYNSAGEAVYLKTTGASALAIDEKELPGHGRDYHAEGFGSPIGLLKGIEKPLEDFTDVDLAEVGVVVGEAATLLFESGVVVHGVVQKVQREKGKIVLILFEKCSVTFGDKVLFQAEWGIYDMAVGERVVSVYAGAADLENWHDSATKVSSTVTQRPVMSVREQRLNDLYQTVRDLREGRLGSGELKSREIVAFVTDQLEQEFSEDWLLRVELLELISERRLSGTDKLRLQAQLEAIAEAEPEKRGLIENGLKLASR